MPILRVLAGLSLAALLAIACWGMVMKVRIDARAHLAEARSRLEWAGSTPGSEDSVAAVESAIRALGCWSPFDTAPAEAAALLIAAAPGLEPGTAARLVDEALQVVDSLDLGFAPLAAEREALLQSRQQIESRRLAVAVRGPVPEASSGEAASEALASPVASPVVGTAASPSESPARAEEASRE